MARRYGGYYDFGPYVPVSEKKAKSQKALAKLRAADSGIQPVVIEGQKIATSWWGASWNRNLERYADYSNRIERGRSYVRHGAVIDLRVEPGLVTAMVQGSRPKPYTVTVTIDKLPDRAWSALCKEALPQLDSLAVLLGGKFPETLKDSFFAQGTGLFPAPKDIHFDCSCPDWASMCKHVAAVLYGIGNRLDQAPELLFTLRQVSVEQLIAGTVKATTDTLIRKAETAQGDDILADADLGGMFGIELDQSPSIPPATAKATGTKTSTAKNTRPKPAKPPAKKVAKTAKPAAKTAPPPPARHTHSPLVKQFLKELPKSRKAFTMAELATSLPDWERGQLTNTLQRAIREGAVERVSKGVYRRA